MRLEAVDPDRGLEGVEPLGHRRSVRWDLELAAFHQQRVEFEILLVLRLMAFRIEPEAHLDHVVLEFLAGRIVVNVPPDHGVGRKRPAGIRRNDLPDLAERVL